MEGIRLDSNCKPVHYEIFLDFDLANLQYTGTVKIQLAFAQPSQSFEIHSSDPVEILKILDQDSNILQSESKPYSILRVNLKTQVESESSVEFVFKAAIHKQKQGCYVSYSNGEKMVISHFEPNYGRMALPCFDEPGLKSTFDLKVKVDQGWTVVSNMPGKFFPESNLHVFSTSPLMSLYLLHWSICKHEKISTFLDSTEISIYTTSAEKSRVFLDLSKDSLQYYNQVFGLHYPLPKLDLIAVFQMSVRAMENWGAITFLENILIRNEWDGFDKFFRDCRTVCHEISHMWFGNLVTMEWWTDLWLNEGFARFMEFKCLEVIRPQFRPWSKFVCDVLYTALKIDTPISKSHPVELVCIDPDHINSYFDSISYLKGASILRMMENLMGPDFDSGLIHYLTSYKYKTVTSDQFFNCMSSFTPIKISPLIRTWTQQAGFPLLTLKREAYGIFRITQEPFDSSQDALWSVPIRYLSETGESGLFILHQKQDILEVPGSWVKLNHNSVGFYRVLYTDHEELFEACQSLSSEDRYGLLDDCLSLYYSERVGISYLSKLLTSLIPEHSYIVLKLLHALPQQASNSIEKELFTKVLNKNSRALWDKFQMSVVENDLEFNLVRKMFLHRLVFDLAEEEVLREIAENHPDSEFYEECLISLFGVGEKSFSRNSKPFMNILIHSKKMEVVKGVVRSLLGEFDRTQSNVKYFTEWAFYRAGESELLNLVLDVLAECENEDALEVLATVLEILSNGEGGEIDRKIKSAFLDALNRIKRQVKEV